jgi:hypothetical protein
MKTKYFLTSKTVYGISAKDDEGGVTKPIFLFDKNKKEISKFIKLCNAEGLEPIHLKDAISDILYN